MDLMLVDVKPITHPIRPIEPKPDNRGLRMLIPKSEVEKDESIDSDYERIRELRESRSSRSEEEEGRLDYNEDDDERSSTSRIVGELERVVRTYSL